MGIRSLRPGGSTSRFDLKDRVKTPSGMRGTVIGMAEYYNGWYYNVHLDGDNRHFKNRKYKESQLKVL